MEKIVKQYTKDNVTVIWKPDQCIHSTKCWKGLVSVFNPRSKPWINMEGADLEKIVKQVAECPSGALSCVVKEEETIGEVTVADTTTTVEAMKNGPLMVYGTLEVKDGKGNVTTKHKVTAFCRCGASQNKPFCDGSHIRVGFRDE